MTYKELEEEARRMGYILVPKYKPHTKVMHCICGKTPKVARINTRCFIVWCKNCGKRIEQRDNFGSMTLWALQETARKCWNEMIKKEENKNGGYAE